MSKKTQKVSRGLHKKQEGLLNIYKKSSRLKSFFVENLEKSHAATPVFTRIGVYLTPGRQWKDTKE